MPAPPFFTPVFRPNSEIFELQLLPPSHSQPFADRKRDISGPNCWQHYHFSHLFTEPTSRFLKSNCCEQHFPFTTVCRPQSKQIRAQLLATPPFFTPVYRLNAWWLQREDDAHEENWLDQWGELMQREFRQSVERLLGEHPWWVNRRLAATNGPHTLLDF